MKTPPSAAFVVIQAEFLLEILIVAPDAPAGFEGADQTLGDVLFGRFESQ